MRENLEIEDYNSDYHFMKEAEHMERQDFLDELYNRVLSGNFVLKNTPNILIKEEPCMENAEKPIKLERVVVRGPAVINFWSDGSRTFSKFDIEKESLPSRYDLEKAVILNYCKKFLTSKCRDEMYAAMEVMDEYGHLARDVFADWYVNEITHPIEFSFQESDFEMRVYTDKK